MTIEVAKFVDLEVLKLEKELKDASNNVHKLEWEGKNKGENAFVLAEWKEADLKKKLSAA